MDALTLRARLGLADSSALGDTGTYADAGNTAPGIVVIGASAGGLHVLNELIPALPADLAVAVLIVVHVRAESPSLLSQTLGARSLVPVIEPDDKQPIEAGRLYIAPPGYHLLVDATRTLSLSTAEPVRFSRPSIDVLFESAAWVYGERVLGIVLSGANDDGARGLEAVRAAGGIAWAQQPDSAQSPEMPRAAIDRHATDEVLDIPAMAARLAQLRRQ